jgi:ubiquinone/menaquinone biosynthesis C-methylase UbiE
MHGQHRFENAEEWVSRFEGPERDVWQKPALVVASMSIREGMVVADIGAGTGYFLPHLVAAVGANGKVVGIDIEPDMVRYMSERIARESLQPAVAQLGSADDPGLAQSSTDRILIVDTWHHIEDRAGYSRKLADALRPAGEVYIVDYTQESPHGPPAELRLSAAEVIAELEAGGLQAEVIAVDLPYQWVVRARKRP